MIKLPYVIILLCFSVYYSFGQVGIGTTAPSILDVTSITQGFLAPRMTQNQRDIIDWYYPCYSIGHNNNWYGDIPVENSTTDRAQLFIRQQISNDLNN
ncbi:hypothetical protein [Flavivirga spongiicola]|uniref:Uncharacterized protein n=1 Tax=Flavivirga spongiicola TaxID=421621 RepID=A0ABU7XQD8_9FLAO|nr:hypothetical protein [Flavivirga sp. MEBiC05379]MDO5981726.1 hypothetical protein [Flavivirga sp. MEBiC05379]